MMNKQVLLDACAAIGKIENLLGKAGALLSTIDPKIQETIRLYHTENANLKYCIRWGESAAKEIREDWHTVVSEIECHTDEGESL